MTEKQPAIYIMANKRNGNLYIGVTSNLIHRAHQHRQSTTGFTARYDCKILVHYELHATRTAAITREKQLKGGSRTKKLSLIEATNPEWQDLYPNILGTPDPKITRHGEPLGEAIQAHQPKLQNPQPHQNEPHQ